MGLVPNNWVFIALMLVQGMCDNSQAVGYSLLADCKQALKQNSCCGIYRKVLPAYRSQMLSELQLATPVALLTIHFIDSSTVLSAWALTRQHVCLSLSLVNMCLGILMLISWRFSCALARFERALRRTRVKHSVHLRAHSPDCR
jgi:hypothetical protein